MPDDDPQRSFAFLVSEVSRLLRRRFDRRASRLGLTRAQWRVLAFLNRNQGINQSALAELLEIEPITLVRQLDRLEAAGLIERRLDPADRRVRLLHLTPKARPVLEQMRTISLAVRAEAFEGVGTGEQEALIEQLLAIKARLGEREGADEGASAKPPGRARARRGR